MLLNFPRPGDLIQVARSEWYALKDGERLRVCETPGWIVHGREIYVTPRDEVRTFWGPDWGPPDGIRPMRMRTAGGPFKTVPLDELVGLQRTETVLDQFWHWHDRPRVGGGVSTVRSINVGFDIC